MSSSNGHSRQQAHRFKCGSPSCRRIITVFAATHEYMVRALLAQGWALMRDAGTGSTRWYCTRCKELD